MTTGWKFREISKDLGETLLSLGYIGPSDLARALARRLRLDYVVISELAEDDVDNAALDMLEEQTLRKYKALPLRFEGKKLVVALSDPNDLHALEDLRMIAGRPIIPVVVTEDDLEGALDHLFGSEEAYYENESLPEKSSLPSEPSPIPDTGETTDPADEEVYREKPYENPEEYSEEHGGQEGGISDAEEGSYWEPGATAEAPAGQNYLVDQERKPSTEPDGSESELAPERRGKRMLSGREKMGEILVSQGKISQEQLQRANEMQRESRRELGEVLLSLGYITKTDLAQAMAQRLRLDFI